VLCNEFYPIPSESLDATPRADVNSCADQIGQDMHGEILAHNRLLSSMSDDMHTTSNSLMDSLGKLGALVSGGGSMHVCHLVAFAVVVFVLLYFAITRF
jgi:hypothetical protein